jgi:chromosome segregation ATPase
LQLLYELEEISRYVKETAVVDERLGDLESRMEILELFVTQATNVSAVENPASAKDIFENYICQPPLALLEVFDAVNKCEQALGEVQVHMLHSNDQPNGSIHSMLEDTRANIRALRTEQDRILCAVNEKKVTISAIDEDTADVSLYVESLQLKRHEMQEATGEILSQLCAEVESLAAEVNKSDAGISAVLGRCGEVIAKTQDQVRTETQTLERIDSAITEAGNNVTLSKERVVRLKTAQASVQCSKEAHKGQTQELTRRASEFDMSVARFRAEIATTKSFLGTCAAQSFQSRAEALRTDVLQVEHTCASLQSEIGALQSQVLLTSPYYETKCRLVNVKM